MGNRFLPDIIALMEYRSTADRPDQLEACIVYIEKFFSGIPGVFLQRCERHGKPSLVVTLGETKHPQVFLCAHVDVVDGPEKIFTPRLEGDILYGRGSCDMKDSAVLIMYLMKEFALTAPHLSVGAMFTTDEEVGGGDGVGYLLRECGYGADVVVVPDSGNGPETVITQSKGLAHIKISAHGISAHGGLPWRGENAIEMIMDAYEKIKTCFAYPENCTEQDWIETCNLGMIEGGHAYNVVPDLSSLYLEVRLTEKRSGVAVRDALAHLLSGMTVELIREGNPVVVDHNDPYLQLYKTIAYKQLGIEPRFMRECGSHDGRYFAAQGTSCIVVRPHSGLQHEDGEWLDVASLEPFFAIMYEFIHEACALSTRISASAVTDSSHV